MSALDRDQARAHLWKAVDWLGWGGDETGDTSDRPEVLVRAVERWLDRLEACVVEDPRIARIEALCHEWSGATRSRITPDFAASEVRAILRGES